VTQGPREYPKGVYKRPLIGSFGGIQHNASRTFGQFSGHSPGCLQPGAYIHAGRPGSPTPERELLLATSLHRPLATTCIACLAWATAGDWYICGKQPGSYEMLNLGYQSYRAYAERDPSYMAQEVLSHFGVTSRLHCNPESIEATSGLSLEFSKGCLGHGCVSRTKAVFCQGGSNFRPDACSRCRTGLGSEGPTRLSLNV
jgi:hypothetical protein